MTIINGDPTHRRQNLEGVPTLAHSCLLSHSRGTCDGDGEGALTNKRISRTLRLLPSTPREIYFCEVEK